MIAARQVCGDPNLGVAGSFEVARDALCLLVADLEREPRRPGSARDLTV